MKISIIVQLTKYYPYDPTRKEEVAGHKAHTMKNSTG